MKDYAGTPLQKGNAIRNIESGWHGLIVDIQGEGDELMLVCKGINWLDGELDDDDTQHHSPSDVLKTSRQSDRPNFLNFL